MNDFEPNWVSAPGETILDILHERGLSQSLFSERIGLPIENLKRLLHGEIEITNDIASKLENTLGGSIAFWIQRELQFRKDSERLSVLNEIIDPKLWIKGLPIKDMINFGWIQETENIVSACLDFFGVPNIPAWQEKYDKLVATTSFRTSTTYSSSLGPTAAWLRQGEKLGELTHCKAWNEELFEETLDKIKSLTRKKNPQEFLPELKQACADCGVALAIARTPNGCRASGATKFISESKALLLLSFRYLSDDQFWFTFFHEAGHILLHGKNSLFIESLNEKNAEIQEEEANTFAAEILIPSDLVSKLKRVRGNKRDIINFALEAGVSPGIVVGQMQYRGFIDYKYLNSFKRRYNWEDISS